MRTVESAHSACADAIVAAMVQPGLADARSSALWLVISISVVAGAVACEPNTDIVASRNALPDARVDSGAMPCDAAECRDAADVAEAGAGAGDEAGEPVDAGDAGCTDPADCGMPMQGNCAAQSCSSVATRADFCAAGQPPTVVLGDSCDATGHTHFKFAVCTCRGLVTNAGFQVSSLAPTAAMGGASVASNDEVRFGPNTTIDGTLYVSGLYGYGAASMPRVTGGVVENAPPACSCDPKLFLDTAALISARARDNDDAAANLTATSLNGFTTGSTLALDCGRYYFDRVVGSGLLSIEARGHIAIFIAGDLGLDDGLTLTLQSGATAEIFIAGNVRVGGQLQLSTTNEGNRVLFAVGGTGTIDLAQDAVIDGSIYAPRAEIVTRGTLELHGSLFVNRANFEKATTVRYQPLAPAREMCAR
jgi:hypothetical protein